MESLDPAFASKAKPGDILVAGRNFGCGSSTPAQHSIRGLGIPAIVAESYGQPVLQQLREQRPVAGRLSRHRRAGEHRRAARDRYRPLAGAQPRERQDAACTPLPALFREMVEIGGEKAYLKARLARANSA